MPESHAYEIAEVTDPGTWDDFVSNAIGGSVFSTSPWLQCAQEATGSPTMRYGCYKKQQLVAGATGLEIAGGKRLITPPLFPHGGLLHRPVPSDLASRWESERNGETQALLEFLNRRYRRVHLTLAPGLTDVRPYLWSGWEVRPRYTYITDLSAGSEPLWNRLERRTRTVIRKAESSGFQFVKTDDVDLLRAQYELVYAQQEGQLPVDSGVVQRLAETAQKRDLTETYCVASPSAETAAIVVFARGADRSYAWVAGADPTFRDSGATSLLYWKFLEQTSSAQFDFVGANMPGIAFFKRGFAGSLVPYFAVEGYSSRLLQSLAGMRRLLRAR